jgi:MoxR-like ATPase
LKISESNIKALIAKLPHLKEEIQKVIVGQDQVLEEMIIALMAGGH